MDALPKYRLIMLSCIGRSGSVFVHGLFDSHPQVVTIPVCFGYWAWFRLVEVLPATIASIATLATPVLGVLSGAMLLGEPVGWREIASLSLVIVSLVLVLYRKPKE